MALRADDAGPFRSDDVAAVYAGARASIERHVARIVGQDRAQDLVHDAFVTYLSHRPSAASPDAWIARVARNRALNEVSRRRETAPLTDRESDERPDERAQREALQAVLSTAIARVPERARRALLLRFFEGRDYPDVAETLGVRLEQAHVVVHRAVKRLGREIVRQLATTHGAMACATALERMAGIGAEADGHAVEPCTVCRPAWDEIAALRWVPALVPPAFRDLFARVARIPNVAPGSAAAILAITIVLGGGAPERAPSHPQPAPAVHAPAATASSPPPRHLEARENHRSGTPSRPSIPTARRTPRERAVVDGGIVRVGSDDERTTVQTQTGGGDAGAVVCRPLEPCRPEPRP